MKKDTILYIDDDEHNLMVFEAYFEEKYRVLTATSAREGYDILLNENVKVVVTDQRMPVENGLDFIRRVAPAYPMVIYIILTAYTDLSNIKEAINSGLIYRYISKPWVNEDMENALENAVEKYDLRKKNQQLIKELEVQNTELHLLKQKLEEENYLLRQNIQLNQRFENIICKNDEFRKLLGKIETIATNDVSVLIEGETGTGKELIAHSIYKLSKRVQKPLVKLNCATLPSSLIESELFGHEKGAF
ncbi:MAG: sigma-54-dependent transcriptional regulator, partial [Bacteroidota bacterium]